ncbi:MAG: hypothetical protein QHH06_03880 [Clostridiales bacterium]|nr:hypothetical protein [Eubacteriales bacterium]MDH7565606.1 hypothetical protein [Clostridiales bacterium]
MALSDETQHNLLFVITSLLFIIYITGNATPPTVSTEPAIFTTV